MKQHIKIPIVAAAIAAMFVVAAQADTPEPAKPGSPGNKPVPEQPGIPGNPAVPGNPATPGNPGLGDKQDPNAPAVPGTPAKPGSPGDKPGVPDPDAPKPDKI